MEISRNCRLTWSLIPDSMQRGDLVQWRITNIDAMSARRRQSGRNKKHRGKRTENALRATAACTVPPSTSNLSGLFLAAQTVLVYIQMETFSPLPTHRYLLHPPPWIPPLLCTMHVDP